MPEVPKNVPVVELDTIRASDAPGPGSSPGGHTMKKNEFFKIRSFFVAYVLEYINFLQNNEIFILFKSVNLSVNSFNRVKYNVYDV